MMNAVEEKERERKEKRRKKIWKTDFPVEADTQKGVLRGRGGRRLALSETKVCWGKRWRTPAPIFCASTAELVARLSC